MDMEVCNISVMKNGARTGFMALGFLPGGRLIPGKERKVATRAFSGEAAKVRSGMIIVRNLDGMEKTTRRTTPVN